MRKLLYESIFQCRVEKEYDSHIDLNYRVATPYGGFDKVTRGITFKLPEVDLNPPVYPELQEPGMKRPTFNRTAQGWISEGTHLILPTVTLEPIKVPESDDL